MGGCVITEMGKSRLLVGVIFKLPGSVLDMLLVKCLVIPKLEYRKSREKSPEPTVKEH